MPEGRSTKIKTPRRAPARPPSGRARFAGKEGETSSDTLYWRLYKAIIFMDLMPGAPISEPRLAAEHGMSRTPVREAIKRLAKDKLVEIVPKSGTFVGRIPLSELLDSWMIRRTLEAEMVRCAIRRITPDDIAAMRAIIDEQREAFEKSDYALFHIKDEALHEKLCEIAGFPRVWNHIRNVKTQLDRYRRLTLPQEGRLEKVIEEHLIIVSEMEKGNVDVAVDALMYHLGKLKFDLREYHGSWPDYFIEDVDLETDLF